MVLVNHEPAPPVRPRLRALRLARLVEVALLSVFFKPHDFRLLIYALILPFAFVQFPKAS
jgi:hypothetical protein